MKKYFSALMAISAFTLFAIGTKIMTKNANAQSSARPYVVFVNGYNDCCVWNPDNRGVYMRTILKELEKRGADFRLVPWDTFRDGARERNKTVPSEYGGWSRSNDAAFLQEAADFINKLDRNRPLILIGHSFGGDSLLSLAPRINRRIQFLGVIDPTAAGGLREPVTRRGVPSNVDYFFNRWQKNAVNSANLVPFDSRLVSGSISGCRAKNCDQQEQSLARKENGSEIRIQCQSWEVSCPGYEPWPGGSNGTKATRLAHNDMPSDAYLQRQMINRINEALTLAKNQHPNYRGLNAQSAGCYYVRSLNNNFRDKNFRWLDAQSNGLGIGLVGSQTHGTVWQLEKTPKGYLLRSLNSNYQSFGNYRWLDGMSNGSGVQLVTDATHGTFWQLEKTQGGYSIKSLNNNFRSGNSRWLDGMSNGSSVQLVNGTSHGTVWSFTSTSCP